MSQVSDVAEAVRSRTLPHLRTEMKNRFAAIRDALPEKDRALLVLRVNRNMAWNEIARVMHPDDESDDALAKAAARLRKRFQFVKDEFRARAGGGAHPARRGELGAVPGSQPQEPAHAAP